VLSGNVPGTVRTYRVLRGRDAASPRDRSRGDGGRGAPLARGVAGDGVLLGALGLVLIAVWVPLSYLTRDPQASRDGVVPAFALACALLGMLVARRQPRNPEGWLLLGLAVGLMVTVDSGLYAVLDYRVHHGQLPLGEIAVFLRAP
jgi:peptidoglycan/LPS O-acetylase OafA/YrhL